MATPRQQSDFDHRCQAFRERLCDADFLANKGLGNEAGIYLFCYDPGLELRARAYFKGLEAECASGRLGAGDVRTRLMVRNLYDVFLEIAEAKHVLDKLPSQEERRGRAGVLRQIRRIAPPERYVERMDWAPHEPGDVLLICGVGEAYPFIRAHDVLNNLQTAMRDVPVVVAYPGSFDGGALSLFDKFHDGNYYRAFDLV